MESDLSCLGNGQRGLITALRFSRGHGDGPAEGALRRGRVL